MYCGIVLTGEKEDPCGVAFLDGDTVETYSTTDDEEIVALVDAHNPVLVALNVAPEHDPEPATEAPDDDSSLDPVTAAQFRSGERELVDEGHPVLPEGMRDQNLLERGEFIANSLKRAGVGCTIIESRPDIIARMLDVASDRDLEQYGIDPTAVEHAREFDALLLALMARMHDEEETEDKDIIVPGQEHREP